MRIITNKIKQKDIVTNQRHYADKFHFKTKLCILDFFEFKISLDKTIIFLINYKIKTNKWDPYLKKIIYILEFSFFKEERFTQKVSE